MPLKLKDKYNSYMKNYRRLNRIVEITKRYYALVIQEFKNRAVLPRHVYELRQVLDEMFKGRIAGNRTELIAESYVRLLNDNMIW
jgi:hypothetical protein